MADSPYYHEGMQCYVNSIHYDFHTKTGTVFMAEDSCTDMSGCIAFFERIDPQALLVRTLAGEEDDTVYRRGPRRWSAFAPGVL
ncbi:hypothetical protein [Brucella tritici]|uniref:hypothetical protein n=1 Tax=Brucella tritici TaxID=94626 RepID=UPI002000ED5D|nr:hypothetical protein [Brucella tritici]